MRVREHLLPSSGSSPRSLARARAGGSHGFVNLHDHSLRTLNLPAPLGPVADACEPPPAFAVYRPNLACAAAPASLARTQCASPPLAQCLPLAHLRPCFPAQCARNGTSAPHAGSRIPFPRHRKFRRHLTPAALRQISLRLAGSTGPPCAQAYARSPGSPSPPRAACFSSRVSPHMCDIDRALCYTVLFHPRGIHFKTPCRTPRCPRRDRLSRVAVQVTCCACCCCWAGLILALALVSALVLARIAYRTLRRCAR